MADGYDRNKDKELFKKAINVGKEKGERYLNVTVNAYDGGEPKVRISPVNKNSDPNADQNKKWINQKAITAIDKAEAKELIKALEQALVKLS